MDDDGRQIRCSQQTNNSMNTKRPSAFCLADELRRIYRLVLCPSLFERVISFLCLDTLDPLAIESIRAGLAVLDSMTPTERQHPKLVGESHIHRIALGSGATKRSVRAVICSLSRPPRKRRQ